jgi:hypothetical protein
VKRRLSLVLGAALALAVPAALAWPGPPKTATPTPPLPSGSPPPAWIETQAKSAWLFWGTYCWKTTCLNLIPPETRPGLPVFTVKRGQPVRVHVGFVATSASVTIDRRKVRAKLDSSRHIVSWSAGTAGILTVSARAPAGSPSYVARLRVQ